MASGDGSSDTSKSRVVNIGPSWQGYGAIKHLVVLCELPSRLRFISDLSKYHTGQLTILLAAIHIALLAMQSMGMNLVLNLADR